MRLHLSHAAVLALVAPFAAAETTTEWLRSEAGGAWTSITTDPFVRQLAAGLAAQPFRRRLRGDEGRHEGRHGGV